MPTVSIIVPILNGGPYIDSIARYIRTQTFSSYEAIFIISSKSTDDSLSKAYSAGEKDTRIRVVWYEDTGALGGSKNLGIDLAKGRHLWFLDVDDVPSPYFLDRMVHIKEKYGADVVGCNFIYSDECSPIPDYGEEFEVKVLNRKEALRARATEHFPVTSWSMLYDLEQIRRNEIRYPSGICEDITFTYSILNCSDIICYYEKPLYKYVITPTSVTKSKENRDNRGNAEVERYDELESFFIKSNSDPFLLRRFALLRIRSAGHMSTSGFLRYIRSDRCVGMIARNPSFEGMVAMAAPLLYYSCIRLFFISFYYRPGRGFTGGFFRRF